METLEEAELCFPQLLNTSCRKPMQHRLDSIFLYILLSCISLLTVALNLLVIISISHFRQLHTPTNLLILSLAVSDFLVGLLLMPVKILLIGGCWFLESLMCGLFYYASFILTSASVGNMVLISVDRYVAICDPLCYPTKVTQKRVKICICLCWACSVFYNGVILIDFLKHPNRFSSCYGECVVVINFITGAVDVLLTFFGPIGAIIVLYMKPVQHHDESIFLYILLSCISLLTVALNLLVIISISHFRQLHTPTNLLILSLAVSDFLVGLLLMPMHHSSVISFVAFRIRLDLPYRSLSESYRAVDVLLTFVGPIAAIIVLYMRVFVVAVSQARGSVNVTAKKSERKAARTLGVVVVVFLICFCPYFVPSLVGQDTSTTVVFSIFGVWLLYCNSFFNPMVYAFFYPWFRRSMKLIVTFQILQPDSCDANILCPDCKI
ncbi:trace amine-associated receptor 13c-like [Morone saxatilis]|uniref:trace amine-associated receptor 13c-like n=1 Tax=Morone saxatilis TaxID=34816 RepID=UPI0015E1F965|nr:trace amine-associated receptor 13c-like [Morone saxatilis]